MKISIITINFNNLEGLKKTIESVINQTYSNIEYIVIDGASKDGSKDIIEKNRDNIDYWVSEPDSGIYNAMNKGIKVSKGEYLLFLNSGDTLNNNDVLTLVSEEIIGGLDIYYGNLLLNQENNINTKSFFATPKTLSFGYLYKRSLPHPSSFIKRTLFDRVFYYNENLKMVSDWEFFICAIYKFHASFKYMDITVSNYDTNGISSIAENKESLQLERRSCLKNHFPYIIDDYTELFATREMLNQGRFKMLKELENSFLAKKLLWVILRLFLLLFRGKSLEDLKNKKNYSS